MSMDYLQLLMAINNLFNAFLLSECHRMGLFDDDAYRAYLNEALENLSFYEAEDQE